MKPSKKGLLLKESLKVDSIENGGKSESGSVHLKYETSIATSFLYTYG